MGDAQEVQPSNMSCESVTSVWKYQRHFRAAAKHFAEGVFKALDQLFEPQLFLVGILADHTEERFPACVEPEKDFWIDAERFNGVLALAQNLIPAYPETGLLYNQVRPHSALGYLTPEEFAARQNPKWGVVSKDLNNPERLFTTRPARADRLFGAVSPAPVDILRTTP